MLNFSSYKKIVVIIAALAYILIFYFITPLELFVKLQVSEVLGLESPEFWRVEFIADIILDFVAIALLQLVIYYVVEDKKYSHFCMLLFLLLYLSGVCLLLFTIFYQSILINKFAHFLFSLVTEPFLTLVLIGAYPIFKLDSTKVEKK